MVGRGYKSRFKTIGSEGCAGRRCTFFVCVALGGFLGWQVLGSVEVLCWHPSTSQVSEGTGVGFGIQNLRGCSSGKGQLRAGRAPVLGTERGSHPLPAPPRSFFGAQPACGKIPPPQHPRRLVQRCPTDSWSHLCNVAAAINILANKQNPCRGITLILV